MAATEHAAQLTTGDHRTEFAIPVPLSITGLQLWLDAWQDQYGAGQNYADGAAVGKLTDFSGNGRHATQTVAGSKPTFKTGIVATRPVARFDGGDELSTAALDILALIGASAGTCFLVMDETSNTGNATLYWESAATNILRFHLAYLSTTFFMDWGDVGLGGRISAAAPGGWAGSGFHTVSLYRSAGTGRIYMDGGTPVLDSTFTDSIGTGSAPFFVGSTSGSNFFTGDIAEVLIYNSALSAANHNLVGNYLASKYGLSWATVA